MRIYIEKENKTMEVKAENVKEAAEKLGINIQTIIISVNGKIVMEDSSLKEGDEIKFLSVISGG